MFRHRALVLALLVALPKEVLAQSSCLDLIPADAAAAIFIRNPNQLRKAGDEFLAKTNLDLGIRPTDALNMVGAFLGINAGWDLEMPSGAVLLPAENARPKPGLEDLFQNLYVAVAFTDLDKMAGNFGLGKGELKSDTIVKIAGKREFGQYALAQGRYLYLAMTEAPLRRARAAKMLSGALSPAQRKAFDAAGILVHIRPEALENDPKTLVRTVETELNKLENAQDKENVRQFLNALEAVRSVLVGVRVDEGLGINFLTTFAKDKQQYKPFLDSLRAKDQANLNGLPDGRVIVAQAFAGEGAKSAALARVAANLILRQILEGRRITSLTDRPTFAGVFEDIWQKLKGTRAAVYLTSNESKLGLFSMVAILDTDDGADFISQMRTLAKIADEPVMLKKQPANDGIDVQQLIKDLSSERYAVRSSATTKLRLIGEPALSYLENAVANPADLESARRAELLIREISAVAAERRKELLTKFPPSFVRPTFRFAAKTEIRAGAPVDIIHVKLAGMDQRAAKQLGQLFGPDWDKLRLAPVGKQVVALLGSDVGPLDTALANVKAGKAGLASSKLTSGLAKMQTTGRVATLHVSVESVLGLVSPQARRIEPDALSAFALAVDEAALQVDVHLPVADLKAMLKEARR